MPRGLKTLLALSLIANLGLAAASFFFGPTPDLPGKQNSRIKTVIGENGLQAYRQYGGNWLQPSTSSSAKL